MEMILFKPNPILDGVFQNNNARDYNIFNNILCNLQSQKANGEFKATIPLNMMREIIGDKNISTPTKIQEYLNNNFRKNTIKWKYKFKTYYVGLLNKIIFDDNNKKYILTIDEDLVDFILNYEKMKTGYTPLNLKSNSRNFYAIKIYEYLRKWSGTKNSLTIGLEELKTILMLEDMYSSYKNFRRKILEPSIQQIKENFNMEVTFATIKTGNKTTAIEFHFNDNETRHYNFDETAVNNVEVQEVSFQEIDLIQQQLKESRLKISTSTINKLKEKYSDNEVHNAIIILCNKNKVKKIKAPVRYLNGILENLKNNVYDKESNNTKNLKFNNFDSREYDYDELERKLLGWDK